MGVAISKGRAATLRQRVNDLQACRFERHLMAIGRVEGVRAASELPEQSNGTAPHG
jgi:hypothetical protein